MYVLVVQFMSYNLSFCNLFVVVDICSNFYFCTVSYTSVLYPVWSEVMVTEVFSLKNWQRLITYYNHLCSRGLT